MTRYRDMTNSELVDTALKWSPGHSAHENASKRLIYALAKRLEDAPSTPLPDDDTPKRVRPDSVLGLYVARGLSREAKVWLDAERPHVWRWCLDAVKKARRIDYASDSPIKPGPDIIERATYFRKGMSEPAYVRGQNHAH